MRSKSSNKRLGEDEIYAVNRANELFDFLKNNEITTPKKLKVGVMVDYKKYVESNMAQMQANDVLGIYWKSAFNRLHELKQIIINKNK